MLPPFVARHPIAVDRQADPAVDAWLDFDPLQLLALLGAAALVVLWARRRFAVPGRDGSMPPRTPRWLGPLAGAAVVVAVHQVLTVVSSDGFLLATLLGPAVLLVVAVRFFRWNRRRSGPVGKGRLVFGNLLVLTIPLGLLLAFGELWFRLVRDTTDSIGYTKVARRWLQRHYRFNNLGFRDNVDYQLAAPRDRRRVTFVGDSFTAGHGIVDVDRRCANLLRHEHPEWDLHVVARNGFDTPQEIEQLAQAPQHGYALQEVVLVYCLNDAMDLLTEWQATLQVAARQAEGRLAVFDSSWLLDTIHYKVAISSIPGVGDYFAFIGDAYRGEVFARQAERLRTLRRTVEAGGGRLHVVTWPFVHALGENYPHREIHERLAAFWRDEGVPHLDLLPHLIDQDPATLVVNASDAHPNERGNRLAADVIGPWLVQQFARPR
ncbi:MAG: SGNH/GDSL hydrolase family protein [Planctomycetes bacterium]|nr:SGNH/GDSL hydrolase family protein [Planctomycetota bacterium]